MQLLTLMPKINKSYEEKRIAEGERERERERK